MTPFNEMFPGYKAVFFIAVHVGPRSVDTERDIETAFQGSADGIFLIRDYKTRASDDDVLTAYRKARNNYPLRWIGVNLLDHSARDALNAIMDNVQGLWFDRAYVVHNADYLQDVRKWQRILRRRTLLFPSIAFKYQGPVDDYARVARLADPHTDTIVTSGEGTGIPADFDKVEAMLGATSVPLGLASGVSADNVEKYLEMGVNFFIVNTSISDPATGRLDPQLVRALRNKIPR